MNIWHRELADDVWVVGVSGRLDQNLTPALEAELDALLAEGRNRLIVDLADVNYINSGGLRCLVTAWRKAKMQEGNMLLAGLHDRVEEVFSLVGFDKVFTIYPTRQAAQQAWQRDS